jgi:transglutaminase-like putative cysteine protease
MTEYTIEYQTKNNYDPSVKEAIFELLIHPCNNESQIILASEEKNSLNSENHSIKNFFGFEINRIRATKKFSTFSYTLKCKVKKLVGMNPVSSLPLEEEKAIFSSHDFYIDNHFFLKATELTTISSEQEILIPCLAENQTVLEFTEFLNSYVHGLLTYTKDSSDIKTTAAKTLELKRGVCQDYAHVFIAMARHNKIPVRYVSGYLFQSNETVQGSEMMHAWVEILIPGKEWIGYDPTNNCKVDHNYIKVAHGNDYADCSPLKGVLLTSGENNTTHSVKVQAQ